jgi:hypothetical protein
MTKLDLEKKKADLLRVQSAKADMLVKIMEREEDIERLKANIEIQDNKIKEIMKEIEG